MQVLLLALPWPVATRVGRVLGDLAYLLDRPMRKKRSLANLRRAFPEWDEGRAKRVLKGVYRHLAGIIVDATNFNRAAARGRARELIEVEGFERLAEVAGDTGVLFVSGHLGCWEVIGGSLPLIGYPTWTLARVSRNPFIERYWRRVRQTTGQRMLGARGALRRVIRLLKSGESIGFLIDQDPRSQGVFVDFFGRPASTPPSVARIAISTGAPVAFIHGRRVPKQARFRLVLKDIIKPRPGEPRDAEVLRITQRLTHDLEEEIRRVPEEWLWLHRRWRTRPGMYDSVKKAVILARGLGTRMRDADPAVALGAEGDALASQGLKVLMPIAGRPFLNYIVDSFVRAGIESICFVIAPDADLMREHAARLQDASGVQVTCAVQQEPLGTADAVLAAEGFVADDAFLVANGDNLYPDDALQALVSVRGRDCWLAAFERDALVAHGNIAAERVKSFAVVTAAPNGTLTGIVEKPARPDDYARNGRLWVGMNLYRFSPEVFDACRCVEPDPVRGELELTAAVADLAAGSKPSVRVMFCEGGVLDLTSRGDVPAAEAVLRERRLSF